MANEAREWSRTTEAAVKRPTTIPEAREWSRTIEVCVSRTKMASATPGISLGFIRVG